MTVVWNSEHLSKHFLKDFGSCVQMTACRSLAVEMGQEVSIGYSKTIPNEDLVLSQVHGT